MWRIIRRRCVAFGWVLMRQLMRAPRRKGVRVSYGRLRLPRGRRVHGGFVKCVRLAEFYPHRLFRFNVLYLSSNTLPTDWRPLVDRARSIRAKIIWNQDGVGYPAWSPDRWREVNAPMSEALHLSDYVMYQSEFCRRAADRFLGACRGPSEILRNAVDTRRFSTTRVVPGRQPILLCAGSIGQLYRFRAALEVTATLRRLGENPRLLVAGRLSWAPAAEALETARRMIAEVGLQERVILLGPYSREEAPAVFQQATVLVHTTYNDACPTTVIEAMASGLPVVYSASGGVPELVPGDAGVGVPAPLSWDVIHAPDPALMADAVRTVLAGWRRYSERAREHAVVHLDVSTWLNRHREVFEHLLAS